MTRLGLPALALFAAGFAFAQSERCTISGSVTDPAGAAIPGASVTAMPGGYSRDSGKSPAMSRLAADICSYVSGDRYLIVQRYRNKRPPWSLDAQRPFRAVEVPS